MSKYVCRAVVEFHLDEHKHTIAQSKASEGLLKYLNDPGNCRWFLADCDAEAEKKGRAQFQEMIRNVGGFDLKDFTFQVFTSRLEEDGYFWSRLGTTNCRDYSVADPAPCEIH